MIIRAEQHHTCTWSVLVLLILVCVVRPQKRAIHFCYDLDFGAILQQLHLFHSLIDEGLHSYFFLLLGCS